MVLNKFLGNILLSRYRRICTKVDASIFDSALSHTCRQNASEEKRRIACPLLDVFACGQVSSPRLYRLNSVTQSSLRRFLTSQNLFLVVRRVAEVLIDFCFCNPWLWLDARNTSNIYMIEKHLIFAVGESSYSLLSRFF